MRPKATSVCGLKLLVYEALSYRREQLARRFAGPLFKFFPPILSPWFVFSSRLTLSDLSAAAKQQLPQHVTIKDVGECLGAQFTCFTST